MMAHEKKRNTYFDVNGNHTVTPEDLNKHKSETFHCYRKDFLPFLYLKVLHHNQPSILSVQKRGKERGQKNRVQTKEVKQIASISLAPHTLHTPPSSFNLGSGR